MGYSADGFPLVGQVPGEEGLYIAASFQGLGMVLCFHSATALVEMLSHGNERDMGEWFPKSFRLSPGRLQHTFRGRLHTKAPMDMELRTQS